MTNRFPECASKQMTFDAPGIMAHTTQHYMWVWADEKD